MSDETRVLLCDDQRLLRQGLRLLLDGEAGISIVGEAANGAEALRLALEVQPDVVLMDLRMPVLDGVAATRRLRVAQPTVRVLVLTTYGDDQLVQAALSAGAAGYLLKDAEAADIIAAIQAVRRGGVWLQTPNAAALMARLAQQPADERQAAPAAAPGQVDAAAEHLTPREVEVVKLIAAGKDNRAIAAALVITEATVKTHVNNIFAKLGASERSQVVVFAYRHGLAAP